MDFVPWGTRERLTPLETSTSALVGKLLNVSRVVERGSPKSDLWNHRGFSPVWMSSYSYSQGRMSAICSLSLQVLLEITGAVSEADSALVLTYRAKYHSHTEKCASCSAALTNLQRLRVGVAVVTVLVWALLPLLRLIYGEADIFTISFLTLAVISGAGIWFGLGKLERRFYQGRSVPPRNLPEKNQRNIR